MKRKILFVVLVVAPSIAVGWKCFKNHQQKEQLSDMVGQMIIVGFRGTLPQDKSVQDLATDIEDGKIGGVILFSVDVEQGKANGCSGDELKAQTKSRNIIDVNQVTVLNKFLSNAARRGNRPPLFVSIDQEGGNVARLKPEHGFNFTVPSAKEQSNMPMDKISELYENLARQLYALGFNLNFSPCVDIDVNPESPAIGALDRSFSSDTNKVSEYGIASANGMWRGGVMSAFKHFPGHGSANTDTHAGLTDITNTWSISEMKPYKSVPSYTMVMVAHVINEKIDSLPASLSPRWINIILRKNLGFNGVVISDDLQMGAIYKQYGLRETVRMAIMAGNDILLLGNNLQYTENLGRVVHCMIMEMVEDGEISRYRIEESYNRIIKMKSNMR